MATADDKKIIFSMVGVSKTIPQNQKQVLKNIYLSFFYGAKIGIIGLNGAGKSTLMKIIAGIDEKYQGEVVWSPGYTVGYLEQDPKLDPNKTVKENVMEGVQHIYDAINDVTDAMKGMLAPKFREVSLGELQVRQVYKISNVGTVAGCRVTSGKITRDSKVRVVRDGIVITEDEIASLKRFKDDAKEVAEGYECGVTLAKFADVKEGDVYEAFKMEEYRD